MLKLTRKIEYALIALRHIHSKEKSAITPSKEIAETYGIPAHLLAKVLQRLAREDIIEPIQGPNGGYRIKTPLKQINMAHFIEILEGPVALSDCSTATDCVQIGTCNIRIPIQRMNESIRSIFNNMSLADVTGI